MRCSRLQRAPLLAALALAGGLTTAHASRAARHWGGADFPFSCDLVRGYRAEIAAMDAGTRAALARQFRVTRKMQRQARECLR